MEDAYPKRRSKRASRTRRNVELTEAVLEAAALRYLNRFDCTRQRMREVLMRKVTNSQKRDAANANEEAVPALDVHRVEEWIEHLLARLADSGYLNDVRYAQGLARNLLERGCSPRQISAKLRQRGVASELANEVVVSLGQSRETELYAASRLVRRRKLGFLRDERTRTLKAAKDLATLARAGFSFETARRVLQAPLEET